jgi:hypothetical protein
MRARRKRREKDPQIRLRSRNKGSKLTLVLGFDILKSQDGGGFLVNDSAKTSLPLNDNIGDAHLSTESWQEYDQLDRVDIVGDDDKRSLLCFDESDGVV